jgi:hypothetical protein
VDLSLLNDCSMMPSPGSLLNISDHSAIFSKMLDFTFACVFCNSIQHPSEHNYPAYQPYHPPAATTHP